MSPAPRLPSAMRLVTQRIAETPPDELHFHAFSLVNLLQQWKADNEGHQQKRGESGSAPEDTVLVNKFRTQISSVLQSKHPKSRWLAVILVKVYLEIGGYDELQSSGPWVRSIAGFLGIKTEHFIVRKASIVTLTKVFILSYAYPNLVRELTTPVLQPFIDHCLFSVGSGKGSEYRIRCHSELLDHVLDSFITLLPNHPASFRPHLQNIRLVLAQLITSGSSQESAYHPSPKSSALAVKLLSLLPSCAPKNGVAEEWSKNVHAVLQHLSRTADHVLRAVEGIDTVPPSAPHYASVRNFEKYLNDSIDDFLGLPAWLGTPEGIERLIASLRILRAFLANSTNLTIVVPVSQIWNTLQRLLSISGPFRDANGDAIIPASNSEVGRDEREILWANLPAIHENVFDVLSVLLRRLGCLSLAFGEQMLDKIAWMFEREGHHNDFRVKLYHTASAMIHALGPSFDKDNINALRPLLNAACSDGHNLHAETAATLPQPTKNKSSKGSVLGQSYASAPNHHLPSQEMVSDPLRLAALRVLGDFLSRAQANLIPRALRASMEIAVILAQDEMALAASVLNPEQRTVNGKQASSLLPFLAQAHPASAAVEALLRPRLPLIRAAIQADISTEVEIDESGPEPEWPISYNDQNHASSLAVAADSSEVPFGDQAVEEPIRSPKRPRYHDREPSVGGKADEVEPNRKRVKNDDTAPSATDTAPPPPVDQAEPESTMQETVQNTEVGGTMNSADDDYEIPPIQMPSDFEDSEDEEEDDDDEEEEDAE